MEPEDAAVIAASLSDPPSFALVFDRHYDSVWRYLASRVGPAAADDLASETFLTAFGARRRFRPDPSASARPWLLGIATNHVRHHRRAEIRRLRAYARVPGEGAQGDPAPDIEARIDATRRHRELAGALARLSEGDRDVVALIVWAELTYEETASALGIPVGTVRSRLNRARRRLRELLGATGQYRDGERLAEVPTLPEVS